LRAHGLALPASDKRTSAQFEIDQSDDYYAPGPTAVIHATPEQLKRNEQGDYYVGDKMILNKRRMEALKRCAEGIKFGSDAYVTCMAREGEAP
jgi:hypothetical protein